MKVLSANLTRNGKKLFEPSTVLTEGALRIGVVGVGPALASLDNQPGVVGTPPIPAAIAEARKLAGKVDLVIVLAALPLEEVLQLSKEAGDSVDLIFHSGDSKRPTVPRRDYSNFLIASGHRGQMVVSVALDLSGEGPLVDSAELARAEQTLALLEQQLAEARQRNFQESIKGLEERKTQVRATLEGLRGRKGRTLALTTLPLGPGVADDAALKARVEKLEPPGSVAHDQPSTGTRKGAARMIQVEGLTKYYGEHAAIRDLAFTIRPGRGHRLPRPQRRGEVHHAEDSRLRAAADVGTRGDRRLRRRARTARGAQAHRLPARHPAAL